MFSSLGHHDRCIFMKSVSFGFTVLKSPTEQKLLHVKSKRRREKGWNRDNVIIKKKNESGLFKLHLQSMSTHLGIVLARHPP